MSILDRIAQSLHSSRPTDIRQYTAFQIARFYNDQARLRLYIIAAEDHSPFELAQIYQRTKQRGNAVQEFFRLLKKINDRQSK